MPEVSAATLSALADEIVRAYDAAGGSGGVPAGGAPAPFPAGMGALNDDAAYAVQDIVIDRLTAAGDVTVCGYKIGGAQPFYGTLLTSHLRTSPAPISLAESNAPLLEPEVLVRTTADLTPDATDDQIAEAVQICGGIEVPIGRFDDWHPHSPTSNATRTALIADNGVAALLVSASAWVPGLSPATRIGVSLDGPTDRAHGERPLADVYQAVRWLLTNLAARGKKLVPGSIVATGTLVMPPWTIQAGDYRASFDNRLGEVQLTVR